MTAESVDYSTWFHTPGQGLEQAELLANYPLGQVVSLSLEDEADVAVEVVDAIILTQSCDIPKSAQDFLLVARALQYEEVRLAGGELASKEGRIKLSRGLAIAQFLIPPNSWGWSWTVIDFRQIYVVNKEEVNRHALSQDSRIALQSPAKESLAQGFARFMMRIGLEQPLSAFEKLTFDK